jgi:hypothetical protein
MADRRVGRTNRGARADVPRGQRRRGARGAPNRSLKRSRSGRPPSKAAA